MSSNKSGKKDKLDRLRKEAEEDKSLPLRGGSTNLVFGAGNPDAQILFIGEGPGRWEDIKGEPFVGNAGAFLNQLLQSIELPREDVYITNVVMYRPPQNRDPLPEEIGAFGKYLDGIIDIIQPKVICTLGRFSMAKFIPGVYISSVHGKPRRMKWKDREVIIVPMYHPAAGLRNSMIKEKIKDDFAKLPEIIKNSDKIENENTEQGDDGEDESTEQLNLL